MDQKEKDKLRERAGIEYLAEQESNALAKDIQKVLKSTGELAIGISSFKSPKATAVNSVFNSINQQLKTVNNDLKKLKKLLLKK
jgi:hypothetical protein